MHIEAYIQHQLSSILWKKSTSFWTPDFFKRTMQCLLPSGLSSSNDTADLDPTTASSEPGDPEPAEPWKERVKRRGHPTGEAKMVGFFHPKKWAPKKCIRTFPNNPLLYPAIGFFCHPNWGLLWWVTPPPQKNGRYLFWSEWPGNEHVVAIFLRTRKFQHPRKLHVEKTHPDPLVQWGFLGWRWMIGSRIDGDWCMIPLVSL